MWVLQEKLKARQAKLQETVVAEALKECTFRPKTNVRADSEYVGRLLSESRPDRDDAVSDDIVTYDLQCC